MEILHTEQPPKGRFYIEQEGRRVAMMTYVWSGNDRIIIDHTEVDPVLRGKNAGKQLVAKAVEFARERGIKIVPLCPFAKSVFDKVPEYQDVL
ncbi:MAG TPA: GNAT family N-acetyltransferase [Fluviicola sp.]|nr:GNAT family N-acetyltransferase [Fluviicola sp.]